MVVFTPNTVIRSTEVNANFDELYDGGLATNAISIVRLAAIESTDFCNGVALGTAGTWYDLKANQNFTVDNANSIIAINVSGNMFIGGAGTPTIASRLVIDSAGTPIYRYLGGTYIYVNNGFGNCLTGAGTHYITGLAAGTHTVKTQGVSNVNTNTAYCRPAANIYESFATYVMELKK